MKIGILGAGKIGTALKNMLETLPSISSVTLADSHTRKGVEKINAEDTEQVSEFVKKHDAIVSALPFYFNIQISNIVNNHCKSYFDFTEDTNTTNHIQKIAAQSHQYGHSNVFVPQCGLAPGAINIASAALINEFDGDVRSVDLRVGALPKSVNNQMAYYMSWSPAGLVNEYIQLCDALYQGKHIKTLPLEGFEKIVIDGAEYEAFNTSGGVATMCETYSGKV